MIVTMSDNRKWHYGRENRKYLYILNHDRQDDNSNGKFAATPSSKKLTPNDCDNDRQPEMKT